MPITIERLRLGIVALAALLVLAIVGSFLYGRWRLRHVGQDLPARLGIQIQQTTKGFVLSQSNAEGRTLFTLRAARAVEFKSGGRVALHNVNIDLYGQQNGEPDTIAGEDFAYDPRSEIVQAQGEAHIVLHAPAAAGRGGIAGQEAGQPVRVTTHGLLFNRKTGVATCNGKVDFKTGDSSGQALGAKFDSRQGHLLLESQVVLTTTVEGRPTTIKASHALYERNSGEIDLSQPHYASQTPQGTSSGSAAAATIFLRPDNSAERLEARGDVRLTSAGGMAIQASAMQVLLNESNRPQQANFSAGVRFAEDHAGSETRGNARTAQVGFDAQGRAHSAVLDANVQIEQHMKAGRNRFERSLTANHAALNFSPDKAGKAQLQSADASGNAVFTSQSSARQKTVLAAQLLHTAFAPGNRPQRVQGTGQTRLQMAAANGDIDTSSGDTLQLEFAPAEADSLPKPNSAGRAVEAQSIRTAVQTGHVVLRQTASAKTGAAPRVSTATAARASYAGATDTLTLTGDPVLRDLRLDLAARQIELHRATGTLVATGAVQATLGPGNPKEQNRPLSPAGGLMGGSLPAHVIAQQAILRHDSQQAVFSGQARLWQGGDTIEAPVIAISQKQQTLAAYGDRSCTACVEANFVGPAILAPPIQRSPANRSAPTAFRITGQRLVYSQAERRASFSRNVQVVSSAGRLTADQAEIFLTASARRASAAGASSVEKIVASGDVRLLQPGRRATGARLVYTAADGHFVLTGNEENPPEVADRDRGTVTGQVLTFASREQAIMVSGSSGRATTTKTRVQQK